MYKFTSAGFKPFNKNGDLGFRLEYISQNLEMVLEGLSSQDEELTSFLTDFMSWLANEINTSSEACKQASPILYQSVLDNWNYLISANKEILAMFLVEIVRCVNFSEHDPAKLQTLIAKMTEAGIQISGDPENCIQMATFQTLIYDNGQVIMKSVE